jgi:arylsulfatase A-like enzyme
MRTTRDLLRAVSVFLVMLVTAGAAESKRPNILLILADDQGYGDLGHHGNKYVKTPNIDRLAQEGIQFERFFVSPLCAPTRASLLTGRYSLRSGVKGVARGTETMRAEEVTIAEALRDAGYRTGIFGKWHNGEHFPYTPQGQGFQEVFGFNLGHWNNYFDTTLKHNGKPVKIHGFIADQLTEAAMGFMETNRNRPFFCYVAFNTPHSPFQVPDKYFDRYKAMGLDDTLACVYGMCANIDDNVGRLLARLDELHLRNDTIVIYLSDNGPNGVRYNAGMRGIKGGLHEGGSRVPCFISWLGRFKAPMTVKQIAAHIDLFPTLLELCNVPLPKTEPLDGRSLVPLLEGTVDRWPDRILFCQHLPGGQRKTKAAVRTQRFRLVREGREWELFDMQEDPGEKTDVSVRHPEEKRRLIAEYGKWWKEVAPAAQQPVPPIPVGYAEENPVELPVPQARFDGGIEFSGKHPNNAWLTHWTNSAARVEWSLDVVRPGNYVVSLLYLCPEADAGSRVRVSTGNAQVEEIVRGTPIHQVPSPDRVPREEVYEMEWKTLKMAQMRMDKGKTTLTVQAVDKPKGQVMDLKAVVLERVE